MAVVNVTDHDIELGKIYWNFLLDLARTRRGQTITYNDLVQKAKQEYPNLESVTGAIPTSIGRRLDMVNIFCTLHRLPDLACLAVNSVTHKPGPRYKNTHDWENEMQKVSDFNWNKWQGTWEDYLGYARRSIQSPEHAMAEHYLYEWWKNNKNGYKKLNLDQKNAVILKLIQGVSLDEAMLPYIN